jgi:hypothetical protein
MEQMEFCKRSKPHNRQHKGCGKKRSSVREREIKTKEPSKNESAKHNQRLQQSNEPGSLPEQQDRKTNQITSSYGELRSDLQICKTKASWRQESGNKTLRISDY